MVPLLLLYLIQKCSGIPILIHLILLHLYFMNICSTAIQGVSQVESPQKSTQIQYWKEERSCLLFFCQVESPQKSTCVQYWKLNQILLPPTRISRSACISQLCSTQLTIVRVWVRMPRDQNNSNFLQNISDFLQKLVLSIQKDQRFKIGVIFSSKIGVIYT